jgi:4-carboxymuconolactone decarboxylase
MAKSKVKPKPANASMFKKGLEIRKAVLGKEYVENSIANADDFTMAFQEITTEYCWGYCWGRDGLPRKTRSILNLGMLAALNRGPELKLHISGALTNGVTKAELKEIFLQVAIYCGIPAGLECFKAAREVFKERGV